MGDEHSAPLKRRLRWLVALAQAAAIVGLLGAVVALLAAGERGPETAEAVLAPSLSRALARGSFGLGVALACLAIRRSLAGEMEAAVDEAKQGASELERLLARGRPPERGASGI